MPTSNSFPVNHGIEDPNSTIDLHNTIKKFYLERLKRFKQNGKNINEKDKNENTLLHLATLLDDKQRIEEFLKHPSININETNQAGNTALHIASAFGHIKIAEKLLKFSGINLNQKNNDGNTPLHIALIEKKHKVAKKLLNTPGLKINYKDNGGNTALHIAVASVNTEITALLLQSSKLNVNLRNKKGLSALHIAATIGQPKLIEELLKFPDIKVNLKTKTQRDTAMHIALELRHYEVAKLFAKQKNSKLDLKNEKHETACYLFLLTLYPLNPHAEKTFKDIFLCQYFPEYENFNPNASLYTEISELEKIEKKYQLVALISPAPTKKIKDNLERCLKDPKIRFTIAATLQRLKKRDPERFANLNKHGVWDDLILQSQPCDFFCNFFKLFNASNDTLSQSTALPSSPGCFG